MRLHAYILVGLILHGLAAHAEDIDVVEAVSNADDHVNEHAIASDRDDNETNSDQLALESEGDNKPPSNKHSYNGPPPPPPPQRNINRVGTHHGIPVHGSGKPFGHKPPPGSFEHKSYNGPPPPPPSQHKPSSPPASPPIVSQQAMEKYGSAGGDIWPAPVPDMPKIISLDVKCEKNLMKVYIGFDKPFYGIVFSKGHYSNVHCVHLPAGLGRTSAHFEIGIHACGTSGNTENGLYGYGAESGSGTFFENIIVIQYDPQVQEVWDQARKLRCTWHDQYEKSVTFRPFPVDMLDVVRTDFAGDNVGCWMQIQVGKGPWASEVSGLVKIGQTMTMVLAIKDDDSKFDMLVRNCMAHDGKRAPIQLVDQKGCVTRPKLMSRFTKIKNFGASASVLSYAHFQAFKFPDSMEVHFQCTIQICRYQCPDQCSDSTLGHGNLHAGLLDVSSHQSADGPQYGAPPPPLPLDAFLHGGGVPRDERRVKRSVEPATADPEKEVGVNRIIRVVSTGDLTFSLDENSTTPTTPPTMVFPGKEELLTGGGASGLICMTTPGFAVTLVVLLAILVVSCLMSAFLCVRLRPFGGDKAAAFSAPHLGVVGKEKKLTKSNCFYS